MAENWKEELRSAYLYRVLAKKELNTPQGRLFEQLATEAENQARIWKDPLPHFEPDFRTRLIAVLIRRLGVRPILGILSASKIRGLSIYRNPLAIHPQPRTSEEVGGRHRSLQDGGNLRAAVFGLNDGLVSNSLLIIGFAGASSGSEPNILLAGTAGLLAGAFSMAAGEYLSVRSQREFYEYQIGLEREELEKYPQEEATELALIYEAKGMSKAEARGLAERIIKDPKVALDTLAREELGLNPSDLASPWKAAGFSFAAFGIGALLPLLAFFAKVEQPLFWGLTLSALCLFGTGAATSLFTGRRAFYGGMRMLLIGSSAALLIYIIAQLFGQQLS